MTTCQSCDAEVVFVKSATSDKRLILDAKPVKGVVIVEPVDWRDETVLGLYAEGPDGEYAQAKIVDVFTDHHVTCPDAPAWVGKHRASTAKRRGSHD